MSLKEQNNEQKGIRKLEDKSNRNFEKGAKTMKEEND